MVIKCFKDKLEMARVAAEQAAAILRQTVQAQGKARLIAATGASQFEFLQVLTSLPGIDWHEGRNVPPGRIHWAPGLAPC